MNRLLDRGSDLPVQFDIEINSTAAGSCSHTVKPYIKVRCSRKKTYPPDYQPWAMSYQLSAMSY